MAKINTKILRVETSVAKPVELQIFRGEQVDLELHFVAYGSPINLERPETAGTGFYWQTEDMGDHWWYEEGVSYFPFDEDKREQGIVDFVWDSALDTGAAKYRWFINVNRDDPADSSYRAFGTIEMLGSPANASITPLPVPPIPIDCSDYTWLNAPWIENTSGSVSAINIGFNSYDVPVDNDSTNGTVGEKLDNLDEGKLPAQYDDSTDSWEVPNIACYGDAYIDVLAADTVRAISLGSLDPDSDPLDVPAAAYSGDAVARTSDLAGKLDAADGEAEGLKVVGPTDGRWFYIGDAGFDDDGLYANDGSNDRTKWDIAHGKGDTTFAIRADLAPAYDDEEEHTYEVNQLVTHGQYNNVYRCKVAHTSDEWVAANWELVTIADVFDLKLDKTDVPEVPVLSVNGQTGTVVLSAASVSALPATPYTQQGYTNTWQLPQNATIIPNGLLNIKASNVIVPSIRSADDSNALLVPNGQGDDWVARRSDIPAVSAEVWSFTMQGGTTVTKSVAVY